MSNIVKLGSNIPLDVGIIHFVGIGGIGMSGIAEMMHGMGYTVRGSDIAEGYNTERLRKKGIEVMVGHRAENVADAGVLVISSAVKADNPEVVAAREKLIPVVRRAEMLAELMRLKTSIAVAGTHGKTTTTTMVATLLEEAGMDPTVINGGIINSYGTNVRLGGGSWMVVEADESDGTFIKIPSTVAVITNIDPEHLDHWGSFDNVRAAFRMFVENLPFYGFAVLCADHPEVQALASEISDRRVITYGFSPQAEMRIVNLRVTEHGQEFDVEINPLRGTHEVISGVTLPVMGQHNAQNVLAAICVAKQLGVSNAKIKQGVAAFKGVKRRFTITGVVDGITVVDDYGHHPAEITATLKAARDFVAHRGGNVIAVVQPHRYTRLRDLFQDFCGCFHDADTVVVADVYAAGEEPIEGINKQALVEGIRNFRHRHVVALESPETLAATIAELAHPKDVVVCLGAGSITTWANALPKQLETLSGGAKKAAGA